MHRHRSIATFVCLFSLWLQMMAPAFALAMRSHAPDPGSVICHSGSADDQGQSKVPVRHVPPCDHCLLCHAVSGGLPPDDAPGFTRLDYPVSSPLRWAVADAVVAPVHTSRHATPRGPPTLV